MSVRGKYISTKKPCITKGILKCRKVKNKLHRKFLNIPSETNEKIYKGVEIGLTKSKKLQRKIIITKNLKKLKEILDLTGN